MKSSPIHFAWFVVLAAAVGAGCLLEPRAPGSDTPAAGEAAATRPSADDSPAQASGEVTAQLKTVVLDNFEDAPRTPDADDPAIWQPRSRKYAPLVIGTLKNAGLQVYDLAGNVVQTISTKSRPAIAAEDPPAPGVQPEDGTQPCSGSESGETFGRFNNVDIAYGFKLRGRNGKTRKVDVAVVSDRGCDTLHFFAIDPSAVGGPLVDITVPNPPRVFPERFVQPSPVQAPGERPRLEPNPIDDQDTAYGLDVYGESDEGFRAAVSQEHRNTVAIVELVATRSGRISYEVRANLHLPATFDIPSSDGSETLAWTPCREEAQQDLQVEGIVVDEDNDILYLSQEIVGLWAIDLDNDLEGSTFVSADRLVEPVRTFGAPFFAVPEDDEFACVEERPDGELPDGTVEGPGNPNVGGAHLEADIEGVTIYYADDDAAYLIVSSQGSSSFQFYDLEEDDEPLGERHMGELRIEGIGSTDGLDVSHGDLGGAFSQGLLVVQNGDAPPAGPTDPIHGFEYDGSSQFVYVRWKDVAAAFDPPLEIEPSH